jgi:hypothetical protein
MSGAAVLESPPDTALEQAENGWIELDEPVRYASQDEMRFGPRAYTETQVAFIERVMASPSTPLPEPALPLDD